jgi:hypothetical protein
VRDQITHADAGERERLGHRSADQQSRASRE